MLTINERRVNEATILDLHGTLLIPDDDGMLLDAVAACVGRGSRLVVFDMAGLGRIDAGGLGALVRSRNRLVSLGGELRLVNPTRFVGEMLRVTRIDSLIPICRTGANDRPGRYGGPALVSAAAREITLCWDGLWNAVYRVAAAACDELPV